MGSENGEIGIRALVQARTAAIQDRNVQGLMALYGPEVIVFDACPPLRLVGRETVHERMRMWLKDAEGPIDYQTRDLAITAEAGVGFCHSLNHCRFTMAGGKVADLWWRETLGCRYIDGEWFVVHEHGSVPFDPQNEKALLDLAP